MNRGACFEAEAIPHLRALYGTACRLTRDVAEAADLVQETYLSAYRSFDRYAAGTNLRAWLYTILYRVRTDAFRRKGRRPEAVDPSGEGPAAAPLPEAPASGGDPLARALVRVPEIFRLAVILRDAEEFTYAEIGKILGVPPGTVMSRIHRGRTLLRQTLSGGGA